MIQKNLPEANFMNNLILAEKSLKRKKRKIILSPWIHSVWNFRSCFCIWKKKLWQNLTESTIDLLCRSRQEKLRKILNLRWRGILHVSNLSDMSVPSTTHVWTCWMVANAVPFLYRHFLDLFQTAHTGRSIVVSANWAPAKSKTPKKSKSNCNGKKSKV